LDREIEKHSQKVEIEIDLVEEKAEMEIKKALPKITKKIRKLEMEMGTSIRKIDKIRVKELSIFSKRKTKLENGLRKSGRQLSRFEREKEKRKNNRDYPGIRFCEKQIRDTKKNISEIENNLKIYNEKLIKSKSYFSDKIDDIKKNYSEKMHMIRQGITDIENDRDKEIQSLNRDISNLEKYTGIILEKIAKQCQDKKVEMEFLSRYIIPVKEKQEITLFVPFYLSKYLSEKNIRYEVLSPVIINTSKSTLSSMKRKFVGLDGKLSDIIRPFSKSLSEIIGNDVTKSLSKEAVFPERIDKEAMNINLLSTDSFPNIIKDGLNELSNKKLITKREIETIMKNRNYWG
jgi:hypothetical protein